MLIPSSFTSVASETTFSVFYIFMLIRVQINCFNGEPGSPQQCDPLPMLSQSENCTQRRFHALHIIFMEDLLDLTLKISTMQSTLLKKTTLFLHPKVSKAVFQNKLNFSKEFQGSKGMLLRVILSAWGLDTKAAFLRERAAAERGRNHHHWQNPAAPAAAKVSLSTSSFITSFVSFRKIFILNKTLGSHLPFCSGKWKSSSHST